MCFVLQTVLHMCMDLPKPTGGWDFRLAPFDIKVWDVFDSVLCIKQSLQRGLEATSEMLKKVASRLVSPAWGDISGDTPAAEQWPIKSIAVGRAPAAPRDRVRRALLVFCPYGTPERATATPPERNSRPSTSWVDERITTTTTAAESPETEEPMTDVQRMHRSLVDHQGFAEADIHVLAPPSICSSRLPTRQNIVQELLWLTTGLQAGDELFFYYAGETLPPAAPRARGSTLRGSSSAIAGMALNAVNRVAASMGSQSMRGVFSRRPSRNSNAGGDLGMTHVSESSLGATLATHALLPCDSRVSGVVSSEQLHHMLVSPLPAGVELICLLDASHSDGLLKMPYIGQPTYVNGTEYYKTGVYKDLERAKAVEGASAAHVFVMAASSGLVHHLASADATLGTAPQFLALTEAYIQATHTLLRCGPFDQADLLTALGSVMHSWACEVATETIMHTTHRGLELPGQPLLASSTSAPIAATDRDGNSSDECGMEEFPCTQHSVSSDGSGRGLSSTLLVSPGRASWTRMTPFSEDEDEGLQSVSDDDGDDGCADMLIPDNLIDEHGGDDVVSLFLPGSQPSITSPDAPRMSNNPTFHTESSRQCTPFQQHSQPSGSVTRASTQRAMFVPPSPRTLGPPTSWLASEMRKSYSMPHATSTQQAHTTTAAPSSPALAASASRRSTNQIQPLPAPLPAPVVSQAQASTPSPPSPTQSTRPHLHPPTPSVPVSYAAAAGGGDRGPAVRSPCVTRVFDPALLHAAQGSSKMGFILNGEMPWQLASQWVAMPIITSSWLVDLNQK